ncbi:hypothetical protein CMV_002143 [Castanea mollissima]|uniref:Uncharacterized protein n=1 Tax=Castanea mollissima TaxID=60419 RepID=A0A8J4RQK7_9ROSI|nr:hypothetical protein CMV_002143 [Castanea mollissima]
MNMHRFGALIRNAKRFYSSSPAIGRPEKFFFADDGEAGSSVFRHALKFQRPATIKWDKQLLNSASFIGTVNLPLKVVDTKITGRFGVHTMLSVNSSPDDSNRTVRILLLMWDEMAQMSLQHVKPNDFIYVSGPLGCYTKAYEDGDLRTYYKVTVEELNYVARDGQGPTSQKVEESQLGAGGADLEGYENRNYLWQVFFTNPYEWRDLRKRKVNPRQPDFKHKDTGEALWLSPNDPPWIKRQLQLLDTKMAEQGQGDFGLRSRVSMWDYDE